MTSRFRNISRPMRSFVEEGMPQGTGSPRLSSKDLYDLYETLTTDMSSTVDTVATTSAYVIHDCVLLDERRYLGVRTNHSSYKDIFFVAMYEEMYMPKLGVALTFSHIEKTANTPIFSVSKFLLQLIPRVTSTIVSDKMQSDTGKKLWLNFTSMAYERNLTVALFNTKDGSYIDISNNSNYVDRNSHKIWGTDRTFRNIRLLVTKETLP